MTRVRVAAAGDIPVGGLLRVEVSGRAVCVAHAVDGKFYAVADACPHEGASLSEGDLLGAEIECPLHGSRFDLRSGQVRALPATEPAIPLIVVVEDDDLFVEEDGP